MRSTLLAAAALAALLLPGVARAQYAGSTDPGSQFARDMDEYYDNKDEARHRGFSDGMFGQSPEYNPYALSEFRSDYYRGYSDGEKLHVR